MKRDFFNQQIQFLRKAFPNAKIENSNAEAYWEMLKDIPEGKFADGVRWCIGHCNFFPSIHELGDASLPVKTRLAPYNPWTYQKPIEVDWQAQLREIARRSEKQLEGPARKVIQSLSATKGITDGKRKK